MITVRQLQEMVHANAVENGWYDGFDPHSVAQLAEKLLLIHAEVSEACEDLRVGALATDIDGKGKPVGFPTELADVVIRALDLAGAMGIDLESAILTKHAYNKTRPYRHGGKAL